MSFFTDWFYRLSPGDTIAFLVLLGFMLVVWIRYAPTAKSLKKKKRKNKKISNSAKSTNSQELTRASGVNEVQKVNNENKINIPEDL